MQPRTRRCSLSRASVRPSTLVGRSHQVVTPSRTRNLGRQFWPKAQIPQYILFNFYRPERLCCSLLAIGFRNHPPGAGTVAEFAPPHLLSHARLPGSPDRIYPVGLSDLRRTAELLEVDLEKVSPGGRDVGLIGVCKVGDLSQKFASEF